MNKVRLGKYLGLAAMLGGFWTVLVQGQLQLEQIDQIDNDFSDRHHIVAVGKDVVLRANETCREIVVISGSASIDGTVEGDVVVIGGAATINGTVHRGVVVVCGSATLGPRASVGGDVHVVIGPLDASPTARIRGDRFELPINIHLPFLRWTRDWFTMGLLWARPFPHQVGWVWGLTGILLIVYVFLSLVFPRPLEACVQTLESRPVGSVVAGILCYILLVPLVLLLAVSIVGIAVIPFLLCGLFLASLFGKAALYRSAGQQIGRQLGVASLEQPLVALVLGLLLFCFLYMIPLIGLVVWGIVAPLGLGAVMLAFMGGTRKAKPSVVRPQAPPPPSFPSSEPFPAGPPFAPDPLAPPYGPAEAASPSMAFAASPVAEPPSASFPGNPIPPVDPPAPPVPPTSPAAASSAPQPATPARPTRPVFSPPPTPVMGEDLSLAPRAGFWIRLWATLIDAMLVLVVLFFMPFEMHEFPRFVLFVWMVYHVAMWSWRGTTIGGIVLGLKVIRSDGRPLTVPVALVRSLLCFLSALPCLIGMFWAGWDKEKQAWHDKIAGTLIVKVPKGMALF